jgi:hypothetical protein
MPASADVSRNFRRDIALNASSLFAIVDSFR